MTLPPAADIFHRAAELNLEDPCRQGNLVTLRNARRLIVAGDLHGHRANLAKIIAHADLSAHNDAVLVLQEIIHGEADPASGHDRSIEPLLRAARLKSTRPEQVLFLLGNHDIAQITGREILKGGRSFCKAFAAGVAHAFGEGDAQAVLSAVEAFLRSLPLAVRCSNGVLLTHSLPSPERMAAAGTDVLRRPWRDEELARGGAVYEWTWGRRHTPEQIDALARELGVSFFVLGHQHVASGMEIISPRAVTLASDHPHGKVLDFSTAKPLDVERAIAAARPIAALGARS